VGCEEKKQRMPIQHRHGHLAFSFLTKISSSPLSSQELTGILLLLLANDALMLARLVFFPHVLFQSRKASCRRRWLLQHETGNGGLVGLTSLWLSSLVSVGVLADPAEFLPFVALSSRTRGVRKIGESFLFADHLGWISAAFAVGQPHPPWR
jgi:hypothetical protein